MRHYVSVLDNITLERVAFLPNAYNVGYTQELNKLSHASFSLPADDPKNSFCLPYRYVEVWDADSFVGLFRILPSVQTKSGTEREIVYTCESVLATLMDDVLFGWHEIGNVGVHTQEVISYVLARQTSPRWQLAECDFQHQFLYGWENENLLSALFSVVKPFAEAYRWEIETGAYPWQLSLKAPATEPKAIIQYRKNLTAIRKTVDPTEICTRLYPLGYGEGVNQLNIADLNNGQLYLDAQTQARYGIVSRIWTDRRYEDASSLLAAAQVMLDELSQPYISYEIEVTQTSGLDRLVVGDFVRVIDHEDGTNFAAQVIAKEKSDVNGNNPAVSITIANKSRNIATSLADIADRQRINETYSQGAVTVFTKSFADNADKDHPAVLRFELPDNMVHINKVSLTGRTSAFRGYAMAVGGGGGETVTTGGGGAFYDTTSAGGEDDDTTYAGGQSLITSQAVILDTYTVQSEGANGPGTSLHNHGIPGGTLLAVVDSSGNILGSVGWTPSGAHEHAGHSHDIELPDHVHKFDWEHTHTVSVNNHTHNVTLQDHVHDIRHGIYEGPSVDVVRVEVDGEIVGSYEDLSGINIIPFLAADESGRIARGQHTIEVYPVEDAENPAGLTRIELDMAIQLFANSRGGGQY